MVIHPVLKYTVIGRRVFIYLHKNTSKLEHLLYTSLLVFFCFNSTLYISNVLDTFASQAGISKIAKSLKMKIKLTLPENSA